MNGVQISCHNDRVAHMDTACKLKVACVRSRISHIHNDQGPGERSGERPLTVFLHDI